MSELRDYPKIEFVSRQALRDWLDANHTKGTTFWLVTFKKHVPKRHLAYGEVVEELLCYGWIDARTRRLDQDRVMLLVAPRKAGSTWSASNKKRAAHLTRQGLMTKAGQDKIEAAKKDGSWTYLDDIENIVIPEDLSRAFSKSKPAREHFEAFNTSAKKVILLWIKNAKREETRAKRVSETVRLAAKNVKAAHPEARGR
jgi:uncharacterized protein YdeI (YjbR/CyaY-like superfamily)